MKSKCTTEIILGISGHGLFTENQNFEISLEVPQNYNFNKIIIFYPNINSSFSIENDLGAANLISLFTENQFFKGFETFVPMDKIRIRPDHNYNYYNFNGAYIENEKYGIVYNSIGINGAKAGDFLQNPIFFEQISAISPDLLVLSFGTNEAFSEIFPQIFISQIDTLVSKIMEKCGEIPVLITTPPFSSAKKNGTWFISQYSKNLTNCKNYAVWNLHELTQKSVLKDNVNSILAKDKIHYTQDGYRRIGGCFAETLIKHYEDFLQNLSE
jgi:lysophospholipase L1-like esterase